MGIGAHAPCAVWGEPGELRTKPAAAVEQLLRLVALHPLLQEPHMGWIFVHRAHGDLMGAPVVLCALTVDLLGARPPLRRAEHDHGPKRSLDGPVSACFGLDALDFADCRIESSGHQLMHYIRIIALDEMRRV